MQSRAVARIALFLGGFAAVISWWAFAATQTVFDVQATRETATSLFAAKPLQENAIKSLSQQLTSLLPAATGPQTAAARDAAASALSNPRVIAAFGDAISGLHEQLLSDGTKAHDLVIDTSAVTIAVRESLTEVDPRLAASIKDDSLSIKLKTGDLPNLSRPKAAAPTVALVGAFAAIALWAIAILLHPQPFVAVRGVGRRLLGIGLLPVVMWVIVPWLLRKFEADAAQTFGPLASGYGKRLAGPALIVACIGLGIWIAGRFSGAALKAARAATGALTATSARNRPASDTALTIDGGRGRGRTQRSRRATRTANVVVADRVDLKL